MFESYSGVNEEFLKIREIIMRQPPKRMLTCYPEIYLKNGVLEYRQFEATFEGVITSHVEHHRYSNLEAVID